MRIGRAKTNEHRDVYNIVTYSVKCSEITKHLQAAVSHGTDNLVIKFVTPGRTSGRSRSRIFLQLGRGGGGGGQEFTFKRTTQYIELFKPAQRVEKCIRM